MDILELVKDIESLKEVASLYEDSLKAFGVSLSDLPDDLKDVLNEVVAKQEKGKWHDLDELYLKEFYLRRKQDEIQKSFAAGKLKAEINYVKSIIEQIKAESMILESWVKKNEPTEAENVGMLKKILEQRKENLLSKKKDLELPDDICVNKLMEDIEILEKREAQSNPKRK